MPKSSKENSAVPRVTRTLRNRVVSVDAEATGRITPTVKKEIDPILENDNNDEENPVLTQTGTPIRRTRRSSQSEAISTPVKTPARRLARRTSLSELENAAISSPLRRSTRKASTLVEEIVEEEEIIIEKRVTRSSSKSPSAPTASKNTSKTGIFVEAKEEEDKDIIEKKHTRSSSKSPAAFSKKAKIASENNDLKKNASKGKKSRTPSPLNISKTTKEENESQMIESHSSEKPDHKSKVLPTVREELTEIQKSLESASNANDKITEKGSVTSPSKSTIALSSKIIQGEIVKQVDDIKSNENSDKSRKSIVFEDPGAVQQSQSSTSKSNLSELLITEDKNDKVTSNKVQGSSKLITEIADNVPSSLSTISSNPVDEVNEMETLTSKHEKVETKNLEESLKETKMQNNNLDLTMDIDDSLDNVTSTLRKKKAETKKTEILLKETNIQNNDVDQDSSPVKLTIEIDDSSDNFAFVTSSNIENKPELDTPNIKKVTISSSKSPLLSAEKLGTRQLKTSSKKDTGKGNNDEAEDNIEKVIEDPKSPKKDKTDNLPTVTTQSNEKSSMESAQSSKKTTNDNSLLNEINDTPKKNVQGVDADIINENKTSASLENTSSEKAEQPKQAEERLSSSETDSGLEKIITEVMDVEQNKIILSCSSVSMNLNDSGVVKADVSKNETSLLNNVKQKEEEKENRKPDEEAIQEKSLEFSILDTSFDKSVECSVINTEPEEMKSNKREETKIDYIQNKVKEIASKIADETITKHLESESDKCEESVNESNLDKDSSKNENEENKAIKDNFSKQSKPQNININETGESSLEENNILNDQKSQDEKSLIEDQTEVIKKQKSVVFNITDDGVKMLSNYAKTPICSKSKSYITDEDPNSSDESSIGQDVQKSSKRIISLDDSNKSENCLEIFEEETNSAVKPDTPLKKIKATTVLSSTPIINSKQQDAANSQPASEKNKSLPLENCSKDNDHGFSKSWSQAVIGKTELGEEGTAFIDGLEHEKKKERDVLLKSEAEKPKKTAKRKVIQISEDDEEEEDLEKNEFVDDEAMEVPEGEESMDSEEREYLKENEIPEQGESIGSEDTDQEEADENDDEENSLNSFIASDTEENNELLSVDSAEFSSDQSSDEENKIRSNLSRRIQSSDESDEEVNVSLKTRKAQKLIFEKKKKTSKNSSSSRRIQSSEESCEETDMDFKTKEPPKLVVESSNDEPETTNNERQNEADEKEEHLDKDKEKEEHLITTQVIDLDTSAISYKDKRLSSYSEDKQKQEIHQQPEEKANSIISVNSSCVELSINEIMDSKPDDEQEHNFSAAADNGQQNNISIEKINNDKESENMENKSNSNKQVPENSIVSSKQKGKVSLITTTLVAPELEGIKTKATVSLNSSEETLSATEKSTHSKTLLECETENKNASEARILGNKITDGSPSVPSSQIASKEVTENAIITDQDEIETSQKPKEELKTSVKPGIEILDDLRKSKKGKTKSSKKRVFSASFTTSKEENVEGEFGQLSSSFTFISKKSNSIENKEKCKLAQEKIDEDIQCNSPNLKEQSILNETYTSELNLDKVFTDSDKSQSNDDCTASLVDTKPKKSKAQKTSKKSRKNDDAGNLEQIRIESLEKGNKTIYENTCTKLFPDSSTKSAKQSKTKEQQSDPIIEETQRLSPIVQVLNKSEAYLETLIDLKKSTDKKIKKFKKKLAELYGSTLPKSSKLNKNEKQLAGALEHSLNLLKQQRQQLNQDLNDIDSLQSEGEAIQKADINAEQDQQRPAKRKVSKESVDYTQAESSHEPSTSRPGKKRKVSPPKSAEIHEQQHAAYRKSLDYIKTSSGIFVQEPVSPKAMKKKKLNITSTIELPTGVVYEQVVTPTSKKVVNGFQETQATPKAIGFKVRNILFAGQKEAPSVKKSANKRKLDLTEPTNVLPKPKWIKSGNNYSQKQQSAGSDFIPLNLDESTSTEFMVAPLKSKKTKTASQLGSSAVAAMDFKAKALNNKKIVREPSRSILQRKQKLKANREH